MTENANGPAAVGTTGGTIPGRVAAIGARLDFATVAQEIVDAVVDVTDFQVATITVCEGSRCRRLATAGLEDGRIGMTTPYEHWSMLLRDDWRQGSRAYLVPPEAPARWADIPNIQPLDHPNAWTADHGLILTLHSYDGTIAGFIAVDEPRSGLLPDDTTIQRLEAFAREAEASFVNARLYAVARRQADTMTQLFDVAKTMASTTDLDAVVPRIITAMRNRFDALEVSVGRVMGDDLERRFATAASAEVESQQHRLEGALLALIEETLRTGTMVVHHLDARPELKEWLTPGTEAVLVAAVNDEGHRTVVLSVTSDDTAAFDAQDEAFLRGLLDITLVAMRNADLYQDARFAAERDALTGLRNRRMFWSTVESMLANASEEAPVSLAVVDVDDFKRLNDDHGHDAGDRALRHVALRLEAGVRETDAVFRIGGEEFVLVMPETDVEGARTALDRIRTAVGRSRLDLPDVSVSSGLAVATSSAISGDDLFAAADAALYEAKRGGKNRVELAAQFGGSPRGDVG